MNGDEQRGQGMPFVLREIPIVALRYRGQHESAGEEEQRSRDAVDRAYEA